jgi:DNA-binding transcriptional MerR regulator
MKTTYPIETKHQFIQLRARDISLSKISEQLDVPKSTLGTWNQDYEAEINCLKRIEWEEVEAQFANSITDDLKRIMHRIRRLEKELDERDPGYFETRELLAVIKESRREYDRKRALYLAEPPRQRDKTRQNGESHGVPASAGQAPAESESSANSRPTERNRTQPNDFADDTHTTPASPAPTPERAQLDESVRSAENHPTQPRNTNDLQQSKPESSESSYGEALPLGEGRGEGQTGTVQSVVTPPDGKKYQPYWLNGVYYANPTFPEHVARAMFGRGSASG